MNKELISKLYETEVEEFNLLHSMIETTLVDELPAPESEFINFFSLEKIQRANAMMKLAISALEM